MSGLGAPSVTLGPTVGTLQGAIVSGSSQSDEQSFGDVFEEARASSRASAPGEPASGSDPSTSGPTSTTRSTAPATPAPGAGQADDEPSLWQPRAGTRASKADEPDTDETPAATPGPVSGSPERRGLGRSPKARAGETGSTRASSGSDSTSTASDIGCHVHFGRRRSGDPRSGRGFGHASAGCPDGWLRERNRRSLGCRSVRHRRRRDRSREPGIGPPRSLVAAGGRGDARRSGGSLGTGSRRASGRAPGQQPRQSRRRKPPGRSRGRPAS